MASHPGRNPPLTTFDYSISELKDLLDRARGADLRALLSQLESDPRKGARSLAETTRRQSQLKAAARKRARALRAHEIELNQAGYALIAGCDEVGRGALAGPLTAAAVILDANVVIDGIDDSKKLTPEFRVRLDREIREQAVAWAVVDVPAGVIDREGLQPANILALKEAVLKLGPGPDFVLSDAFRLAFDVPSRALIKGDSRSVSIAAASIVAKVHRDRLMESFGRRYCEYGFSVNKGYGTAAHLAAIREIGPSPIHRRSFCPVSELTNGQLSFLEEAESSEKKNQRKE